MRENGLRQILSDEEFTVYPTITDNPEELGPQDYVILTLKSYQAPGPQQLGQQVKRDVSLNEVDARVDISIESVKPLDPTSTSLFQGII